nr:EOG090X0AR4 [Eulimnadia texana]
MAKSKYEYVKKFETDDRCLLNTWIVVRIDGKGFHKFSAEHEFVKPNDERALQLMVRAARTVVDDFKEIVIAYGQSDEFSFVFRKDAEAYNRRASKLQTYVCSLFTSAYLFHWSSYFPTSRPKYPPAFDGRVVLYPTNKNLRDYLSWRQADCHINNLYNTIFWALVQKGGLTPREAQERLRGTTSGNKNEILFSEFGINYNKEPEMFRKGTVIVREKISTQMESGEVKEETVITETHQDIIGEKYWRERRYLLGENSE